ncbi:conserved hypothetical protein [Talaromyces stipitatus ATCC 10500]|uniref:RecA family profile 1 domain-containing protein n=1 Tax=Talaromyces stipitatus (strain ATCC 10500 / CBS 375.48 / QM 6759 / NRRL 1006) TaxID=441959 RepID=B8M3Y1_TALSN|nr:uncharacterized protein TSTA_039250 [Talaromyces stipitatus ATCC 10500]EED20724.1 conserved hypothetical protein [Talaromyces stipitatus ATCC 10500]
MTDYDFLNEATTTPRISSISASQALRASSTQHASPSTSASGTCPLRTGLDGLDDAICAPGTSRPSSSGIPRGSITEIYGPPGVGKTAISLNIAAKVLTAGDDEKGYMDCTSNHHSIAKKSSKKDTISAPFQSYFPNATEIKSRLGLTALQQPPQNQGQGQGQGQGKTPAQTQLQWLLNRKWNVTSDMINKITRIAAEHHLAVLLLNQTHTKIKGQPRPTLYPALAGGSWENCVQTRVVIYRDHDYQGGGMKVRYAEVMKKAGKVISVRVEGNVFPFVIEDDGLRELRPTTDASQQSNPLPSQSATSTMTVRKRKVDEIADSEDEDEDEFLDAQDDDLWDEENQQDNDLLPDGQE